jgi:hypothetical protein
MGDGSLRGSEITKQRHTVGWRAALNEKLKETHTQVISHLISLNKQHVD